jgi:hypothetical protein
LLQYAKASDRVSQPQPATRVKARKMRVCGRLRPFPGRASRRCRLRGRAAKPPFLRSARWKARSLSTRLAFRSQGVATWRGSPRHETPTAMPGHAFGRGGVATGGRSRDDRPFVGRGHPVRGSLLLRQRRRSRCEGPAWRAVGRNVPPFFSCRGLYGLRRRRECFPHGKRACGVMATSARTRRLLLYHGRVAPLKQIL